jgi:transcriptional regulator with XRE-family HTH domain
MGPPLGLWLRQTRASQGLTQKDLAERAGLSRSYLCDIERGRGASPSVTTLDQLARALGIERSEVLRAAGVLERPAGQTGDVGERRLVALYRDLSPTGKGALERFARFLHEEEHRVVQPSFLDDLVEASRHDASTLRLFDLDDTAD